VIRTSCVDVSNCTFTLSDSSSRWSLIILLTKFFVFASHQQMFDAMLTVHLAQSLFKAGYNIDVINIVACCLQAWTSESQQTSIARQRLGNYVLYYCLGMPESRISGFNLETSFPRQRTKAFLLYWHRQRNGYRRFLDSGGVSWTDKTQPFKEVFSSQSAKDSLKRIAN
jgi:hypothetical protein